MKDTFVPKNQNFRTAIDEVLSKQHFMHHLEFKLTRIDAGYVIGDMPFKEFHMQQNGFLHGGAIATVCDLVAGFAAYSLVGPDEYVMTVELKISYLNPGVGKTIVAKGSVLKTGSRLHFCESEVFAENEGELKLIAKATATMITLPKPL